MSAVDISEVVSSSITAEDSFPSRQGFGTPMVVGYHTTTVAPARVQSYSRISEVAEDYGSQHPIYKACAAIFAQNPRPATVKVGRRAGAPTQTIRLTPVSTTLGYVYTFSIGGVTISYTVPSGATVATIVTALVAAIGATVLAADDDAILTALATSASTQTIDTEANGVIALAEINPPRKITITRSAHVDHDAVTAVLAGIDEHGNVVSENIAFANGGAEVLTSTKIYSYFTSLTIPAQAGTGGTTKIGIAAAVTATDGTTHLDVTAGTAGQWFQYGVGGTSGTMSRAEMLVEDRTSNPATTIESDLTAIFAADPDWYGLVLADGQSSAQILDAADWCTTNQKLLSAETMDSACCDGTSTSDVISDLEEFGYHYTAPLYSRAGHGYFTGARWFGAQLPKTPGTETWGLRNLAGAPVDDLTATERTALKAKTCNFYASIGGEGRVLGTNNGGVASSGRFLDLVRFIDSKNADIKAATFASIVGPDKIPYTKRGFSIIEGAIRAQLKAAERIGALRDIILTAPDVDDADDADVAARIARGFEWTATYTGAVHSATIEGRLGL